MAGLIANDDELLTVRQEATPSVVNVFQSAHFNWSRLPRSKGKKCDALWAPDGDRDRPFSIRGKATRAAVAKPDGQRTIHLADRYRISRPSSFTGIFKKNELAVACNILGYIPVVPR